MSSDAALDPRHPDPGFGAGIGPNATIRRPPTEHPHPARYSAPIMELLTELLADTPGPILDPFAGTGRIHELGRDDTLGVELEPEWAALHNRTIVGDATRLPLDNHSIGTICTSPTYGNRMADTYNGRDGSRRHTYRIALGRDLTDRNTGALQWGDEYRQMHAIAWAEAWRVLRPGGRLLLNISDHIRQGERQHVTHWHTLTLLILGFKLADYHRVETRRQRHGANSDARVDHEAVIVLRKPA